MNRLLATDGTTAVVLVAGGRDATLVDHADLDAALLVPWSVANNNGHRAVLYSCGRAGPRVTIHLGRLLMGNPAGMVVDHINGDGLDNRRSNLRVCTRLGNAQNRHGVTKSTGVRGVRYLPWSGRWQARILVNGKSIALGTRATKEEALDLYNAAVVKHHGEYGCPVTLGGREVYAHERGGEG